MKGKKWGDISMYKTEVITDNKQNERKKVKEIRRSKK